MTGFEDCNFSRVAAHGPAKGDGGELVIAGGVCLGALGGVVGAANVGTACGSIPVWLDSSLLLALSGKFLGANFGGRGGGKNSCGIVGCDCTIGVSWLWLPFLLCNCREPFRVCT